MSTPNIRDLESLFYGNGESAKYAALKAFADAGVDATDLLDLVGGGGLSGVVVREAEGEGEEPTEVVYALVADDLGKLVVVFTQAELPVVVELPDDLGAPADRIELAGEVPFELVVDGAVLLVPGGLLAESRDEWSLVTVTKVSDGGGEASEQWLVSGDLAPDI